MRRHFDICEITRFTYFNSLFPNSLNIPINQCLRHINVFTVNFEMGNIFTRTFSLGELESLY